MDWQPIDTAPRDSTEILLCLWGTDMVVAYFDPDATGNPWKTLDGPGYHLDAPTFWMPLPDLPPYPEWIARQL